MRSVPTSSAAKLRLARRLACIPALGAAGFVVAAGLAGAATPAPGAWNSKHAHFTVNPKMTRVTEFTSRCAGYPLPLKMKITPGGTFSYKRQKALMGGKPLTEKVHGVFTSLTTAKVTASYGRCHEKFTAKTKVAPVETTPTDTTDTTPTDVVLP